MNIKEELLIKQAQEGYTVCYIENCPLRDHCLRWLVGQHLPNTASTYRCVNPHFEGVATAECPMCRNDQKVRFAKGMTHTFTSDMPRRVESEVRYGIIGLTNRTYYFRIPQRLAPHPPCPTGRHPQPVSQKRMDRRSEIRRVCRGLQLVVTIQTMRVCQLTHPHY